MLFRSNALVQAHISSLSVEDPGELVPINSQTIALIQSRKQGPGRSVVNLVKSIEKAARENSADPFLIAMAERARLVQHSFEHGRPPQKKP